MATPKSQRIGIWVIASVLMIGTVGSFAVMILQSQNSQTDQQQQQKLIQEYQKQLADQQKQADELSNQYYAEFSQYKGVPTAFDMNSVGSKVTTNDLKPGTGAEIKSDTKYKAYYIGWNPKGITFDSSISDQKLKAPIDTSSTTTIEGWSQGVVGMKAGGVRELTIPSDLAYKDQGSGDNIPPNTPIKFIVVGMSTE